MFGKKREQQTQSRVETKEICTMPSSPISESWEVVGRIEDMAKKGWRLVGRQNQYLFFCLAVTTLRFARPSHIRGVPTDRIKFDVKTRDVESLPLPKSSPQRSKITAAVQEMNREGWVLAGKTQHEGFFGLTPYTHLVFLRPRR